MTGPPEKPIPPVMRYPNRMRELRWRRHLAIPQLAARLEMKPKYISELERGVRHPSYATMRRIASVLRCKVEDLWEA